MKIQTIAEVLAGRKLPVRVLYEDGNEVVTITGAHERDRTSLFLTLRQKRQPGKAGNGSD